MAQSITCNAMLGAATLIMAISCFATLLPAVSIFHAAFNVRKRAWSIMMRASAIRSRVTPWSAIGLWKATRLSARLRPGGVKEASVRVDLRFGSFSADRQKVHDWESEWFPERAQGREERP